MQRHSVENKRLPAGILGPYRAMGRLGLAYPPAAGAEPESSRHLQGQSCGLSPRGHAQKVCAEEENQQRSPAGGPVTLMSLRRYTQKETMN